MLSGAPIQNLDKLDIVGERTDGGVDLVIVVSGPLDGSSSTLMLLERKIRNYIAALSTSELRQKHPPLKGSSNSIYVVSEHPVDALALDVIERLRPVALRAGANLEFRCSME
jgi:hypothetical protein